MGGGGQREVDPWPAPAVNAPEGGTRRKSKNLTKPKRNQECHRPTEAPDDPRPAEGRLQRRSRSRN